MRWRTFVNIAIGFLLAYAIGAYIQLSQIDRANEKLNAVIACAHDPAYNGVTPEDTAQLFTQCLDDYKSAK